MTDPIKRGPRGTYNKDPSLRPHCPRCGEPSRAKEACAACRSGSAAFAAEHAATSIALDLARPLRSLREFARPDASQSQAATERLAASSPLARTEALGDGVALYLLRAWAETWGALLTIRVQPTGGGEWIVREIGERYERVRVGELVAIVAAFGGCVEIVADLEG